MKRFASLLLILAPLMEAYFFPGTTINFWKVVFILVCFFFFIRYAQIRKLKWPANYKTYFIYGIFSSIIGSLYFQVLNILSSSLLVNLIYIAALLLIVPQADILYCKKYYGVTVAVVCAIFLLQELMYHSIGYRFSGLIPFLDVPYEGTTTAIFISKQEVFNRSSSLFLEPAHFAQYCSGYLAIMLGENCRNKKLFSYGPIVLSIIMFLTISGNAIILILVAWITFFILFFRESFFKFIFFLPVAIVIGIGLFNYISTTEQGQRLLERQDEMEYDSNARVSSGTMRIYRGYLVYEDMPLSLKILGVGTSGTDKAIENSTHFWMFDKDRYVNNIQKIIIGSGLIGLILFLIYCYKQIKLTTDEGKILMFLFITMSLVEYCWLFPKMLIFCGLAWLYQLDKKKVQRCQNLH